MSESVRHFVGGSAVGFMFAILKIPSPKPATQMSHLEFFAFVCAHAIVAVLFGLAAWGLL